MTAMVCTGKTATLAIMATACSQAFVGSLDAQLPSPLARFGNLPCLAPIIRGIDREAPANIGEALLLPPYDAPEDDLQVGTASFPITTTRPEAQEAFNHGIALLHLFWTVEAERSFRRAASLDPEAPMPYWGMAMANERLPGRASVYINYANHLAGKNPATTRIEHAWITTYRNYFSPAPQGPECGSPESRRLRNRKLEDMAYAHPDSFEIRAFLLREIILDDYRAGIPLAGKFTTDALATQLARQQPKHPSRHYRLWLWSRERPMRVADDALSAPLTSPHAPTAWRFSANALASAGRFHDALRAGENALRLAHRRMLGRFTIPEEAQNYVSYATAQIDTMIACGRIKAAESAAQALISLPRSAHPGSSTTTREVNENGSHLAGRRLLVKALIRSEQWNKLLDQCTSPKGALRATKDWVDRAHALYWQAIAHLNLGKTRQALTASRQMESLFREFLSAGSGVDTEKQITHVVKSLRAYSAFFNGTRKDRPKEELMHVDNYHLARLARNKDSMELALSLARQDLLTRRGQPDATASFCSIAYAADNGNSRNEALLAFDSRFRRNASLADRDNSLFSSDLQPLVKHLNLRGNWTLPQQRSKNPLALPSPEELGPLTWTPPPAPSWSLPSAKATTLSLAQFKGKPVLLIFFVGIGCPYCVEQLKAFTPFAANYASEGIEIITISSDEESVLENRRAVEAEKTGQVPALPFPLLSDASLKTFRDYRCFDPIDNKAMHGVVLISPQGKLLWSNISHEPFLHPEFLLKESSRLLSSWTSTPD